MKHWIEDSIERMYIHVRFRITRGAAVCHIYHCLDEYPENVSAGGVITRIPDGLGFRFYWATAGLKVEDYRFCPENGAKSIGGLIGHVWGLSNWMCLNIFGEEEVRPKGIGEQRDHALQLIKKSRDFFCGLDEKELMDLQIEDWPFWHFINGPISDALTHVGQINSFRRMAGNPPIKANVFLGQPPEGKSN